MTALHRKKEVRFSQARKDCIKDLRAVIKGKELLCVYNTRAPSSTDTHTFLPQYNRHQSHTNTFIHCSASVATNTNKQGVRHLEHAEDNFPALRQCGPIQTASHTERVDRDLKSVLHFFIYSYKRANVAPRIQPSYLYHQLNQSKVLTQDKKEGEQEMGFNRG